MTNQLTAEQRLKVLEQKIATVKRCALALFASDPLGTDPLRDTKYICAETFLKQALDDITEFNPAIAIKDDRNALLCKLTGVQADYFNDLNACHQLEELLLTVSQKKPGAHREYLRELEAEDRWSSVHIKPEHKAEAAFKILKRTGQFEGLTIEPHEL